MEVLAFSADVGPIEINNVSVAAPICHSNSNCRNKIKSNHSLLWITWITEIRLLKLAMNSSIRFVCFFWYVWCTVLFSSSILLFLAVAFYFLLTKSYYAGSRWSLKNWALSLLRKVASDSAVLTLVRGSFHHWGARTEKSSDIAERAVFALSDGGTTCFETLFPGSCAPCLPVCSLWFFQVVLNFLSPAI